MTNRASNKLTTTRKMTVRMALASGATIATLMGVQTLGTRDLSSLIPTATTAPADLDDLATATTQAGSAANLVPTATNGVPTVAMTPLAPAAPKLVIIRNAGAAPVITVAGQPTAAATKPSTSTVIKPPNAVVVEAPSSSGSAAAAQPAPSQPMPSTRSSR